MEPADLCGFRRVSDCATISTDRLPQGGLTVSQIREILGVSRHLPSGNRAVSLDPQPSTFDLQPSRCFAISHP
jgi:hypothetical protein